MSETSRITYQDQVHILDIAISALKQEMWIQTGQPPRSMHQFADWAVGYFGPFKNDGIKILQERVPGIVESMIDIQNDFWESLWMRIQNRKMMNN